MRFIETRVFTKQMPEYLSDDEFRELQQALVDNPTLGDKIPGSGGIRKARWPSKKHGKGKRGGLRIIYFYHITDANIYLLILYEKGDMKDMNQKEIAILKSLVEKWE